MAELVNFRPTKELFIKILTRDISIRDCILDLLDNAIDSYTRNKIDGKREVRLNFDKTKLSIFDNCGGIEKERLKKEVFRFGVKDFSICVPTIGVYGIGLKRSIFKLGELIIFETDDGKDYCKLKIDVKDWINKKDTEGNDKWDLDLTESSTTRLVNGQNPYTNIEIKNLRYETKETFTPDFEKKLKETVKIYYSRFIQNEKINFYINNEEQRGFEITVKSSDDFKPVKLEDEYKGVRITIICWLDLKEDEKRARKESGHQGWNIFMNDRLVIVDDTSEDTGWVEGGSLFPKFHQIYNQFRGVVFLKTNDPSKLPINTSKNGFNKESEIYYHLLNLMVKVARPFINFLSIKYKTQKEKIDIKEDELLATIDKGSKEEIIETPIDDAKDYQATFIPPTQETETRSTIPQTIIRFSKPRSQVDIVKKILKVYTNKQVGEKLFDYFWESEGLNQDE